MNQILLRTQHLCHTHATDSPPYVPYKAPKNAAGMQTSAYNLCPIEIVSVTILVIAISQAFRAVKGTTT